MVPRRWFHVLIPRTCESVGFRVRADLEMGVDPGFFVWTEAIARDLKVEK